MAPGTRELRKGDLLEILGEIFREKDTGTLVLQQADVSRFLYLQEGNLIFAASNAPEDKFTQILIDQGKLTYEQLDLATEKKGTRTIGRTLVEMGFLSSDDLLGALVDQLKRIAFSAQNWDSGTAAFKPGVLPQNVARLPISTPRFLVDLALATEDRDPVAQSLGHLDSPLTLSPQDRVAARALGLSPDEARLLEQVDGARSARQACERAGVELFTGARFLMGLAHVGLLKVQEPVGRPGPTQPVPVPVDLSFLDDSFSSGRQQEAEPPAPEPPAQPAPPSPAPLPFAEGPAEGDRAPVTLIEEKPAARSEKQKRSFSRDSKSVTLPELLPVPSRSEEQSEGEVPSFLLEKPSKRSRGRWIGILAAGGILVCAGLIAGWYFLLRESPVVTLPPTPPPRHKAPESTAPAPAKAPPAAAQPADQAPVPSPAQSAPQEPKAPEPSEKTAPAAAAPRGTEAGTPTAKPAAPPQPASSSAAPSPAPPSAAGSPWDLLAKGDYPAAARAFRSSFQGRKGGYVVNIEVACQAETVAKGLAAAAGSRDYAILPYDLKGRSCYLVVWGDYPDRPAAESALKAMPAFFLQNAQPRVVPWSKIQELTASAP